MATEQSELNPESWGLLAKSWLLHWGMFNLLDLIFFCAHPQPPPLKNNAGEKCLFGNLICMENILFLYPNLPVCVGFFHLLSAKTIFHYFSHPKYLLRNWMLLPKMGIFSFPFTPFYIHNIPQTPENKLIERKHISFKNFPWKLFCCG